MKKTKHRKNADPSEADETALLEIGAMVSAQPVLATLGELNPNPSLEAVRAALFRFSEKLLALLTVNPDSVLREQIRSEATKRLNALGVADAKRLTKEAVAAAKPERPVAQQETLQFPEPEPWPEPVDGAGLLDDLAKVFERYVVLPAHGAVTLALWVLWTHVFEAFHIAPILALTSPVRRCGKTTTEEIANRLTSRALMAANITAAALFRTIEKYKPTLIIDEVDTFVAANPELVGLLNAGHTRDGAVIRLVGDNHEPKRFSVFCPKMLAYKGSLPPTVSTLPDRSIVLYMRRRAAGEHVERLRLDRLAQELEPFRRRASRWARDNFGALRDADPPVPEKLHDRARDNWRSLIVVAERAGGPWPDRARRAAIVLSREAAEADESHETSLLSDLRDLFARIKADRISSSDLIAYLCDLEGRPWADYSHGKAITAPQIARLLRGFRITPRQIREGHTTHKGYYVSHFSDAFTRYLPPKRPKRAPDDEDNASIRETERTAAVSGVSPASGHPIRKIHRAAGFDEVRDWVRSNFRRLQEQRRSSRHGK